MSNLKKVLALTLVLVMTAAFAVTANAATFTDAADITAGNLDKIAMLGELAIMNGYPEGDFRPNGNLTRAEFAKMIYVALNNGNDDGASAYKGLSSNVPFTDTKGHWAEGYINFAYSAKIVSGRSATIFDPQGTVTGYEALKMLCVALGWNPESEGFTGPSWQLNVLRDAQKANLLEGFKGDAAVSLIRDNAALVFYNTVFAYIVEYNTDGIIKSDTPKTFAEQNLRMKAYTGVLLSNEFASIDSSKSNTKAGESYIDVSFSSTLSDKVTIPAGTSLDMLGKNVSFYVRFKNSATIKSDSLKPDDILKVFGSITETPNKNKVWTFTYGGGDLCENPDGTTKADFLQYKDSNDKRHYVDKTTTPVYVNYGNMISSADFIAGVPTTVKNGSIVNMVDNDDDGDADYVFITTKNYGKVTANSGSKLTVSLTAKTIADDDYTNALGTPIKDLVKDDRILFYQIVGCDKWYIEKAPTVVGTLTGYKGNLTTGADLEVRISGSYYKASNISGNDFSGSTATIYNTDKYKNVELTYYTDGTYLCEAVGTYSTDASGKYLVIVENNIKTGDRTTTIDVKVLKQDKTTATYNLKKINGAEIKYDSTAPNHWNLGSSPWPLADITNWTTTDEMAGQLYSYTISGTDIELKTTDKKTSTITASAAGAKVYSNKDALITLAAGRKSVDTSTYVFAKKGDDWKLFVGKNETPNITCSVGTASAVNYFEDSGTLKAISFVKNFNSGSVTTNFGAILTNATLDSEGSDDVLSFMLWNGTELIDVKSTKEDDFTLEINGTEVDFDPANIKAGDVCEFTTSGPTTVDSVKITRLTAAIRDESSPTETFKFGYITKFDNDTISFQLATGADIKTDMYNPDGVKVFSLDNDKAVAANCTVVTLEDITTDETEVKAKSGSKYIYTTVFHFNDDGKVDIVYKFNKDIEITI